MKLQLAFTSDALTFVERLPLKLRTQVVNKIKALTGEPHPPGSKKLSGVLDDDGSPVYRERSGDYRILYVVYTGEILILDVDDRKDVYQSGSVRSKPSEVVNEKAMEELKTNGRKKLGAGTKGASVVPFPGKRRGQQAG